MMTKKIKQETKQETVMTGHGSAGRDRHGDIALALMGLTKHQRERVMIEQLQNVHGYMFLDMTAEDDRYTMHFRTAGRLRNSGKWKLIPARVLRASMPDDSWLAKHADDVLKTKNAKATAKMKTKAKAKTRARARKAKAKTRARARP
jgi:hypothetical protein